jgi:hypothetical protein
LLGRAALALQRPPSALDHGGVRYERARRLPVKSVPEPDAPWPSALLVNQGSAAKRCGRSSARASAGPGVVASSTAELELWGGGAGTLAH